MEYTQGAVIPGTPFKVNHRLGDGGYGEVYDVYDTSVGKRRALKLLKAEYTARREVQERMVAEARTMGRIGHKNVVEVIGAGWTQERPPRFYILMELLDGLTLAQSLERVLARKSARYVVAFHEWEQGKQDPKEKPRKEDGGYGVLEAIQICIQVAKALEAVHKQGIIHRDLKTDNVLIHRVPAEDDPTTIIELRPKLIDFGIAQVADLDAPPSSPRRRLIGTPIWLSPEQCRGDNLTTRADLYALGLVLYELITGRGPFDEHILQDLQSILNAHMHLAPPPLRTHWSGSDYPEIDRKLDRLVARLLAKEAHERPASAKVVAEELYAIELRLNALAGVPEYREIARTDERTLDFMRDDLAPMSPQPQSPPRDLPDLPATVFAEDDDGSSIPAGQRGADLAARRALENAATEEAKESKSSTVDVRDALARISALKKKQQTTLGDITAAEAALGHLLAHAGQTPVALAAVRAATDPKNQPTETYRAPKANGHPRGDTVPIEFMSHSQIQGAVQTDPNRPKTRTQQSPRDRKLEAMQNATTPDGPPAHMLREYGLEIRLTKKRNKWTPLVALLAVGAVIFAAAFVLGGLRQRRAASAAASEASEMAAGVKAAEASPPPPAVSSSALQK